MNHETKPCCPKCFSKSHYVLGEHVAEGCRDDGCDCHTPPPAEKCCYKCADSWADRDGDYSCADSQCPCHQDTVRQDVEVVVRDFEEINTSMGWTTPEELESGASWLRSALTKYRNDLLESVAYEIGEKAQKVGNTGIRSIEMLEKTHIIGQIDAFKDAAALIRSKKSI